MPNVSRETAAERIAFEGIDVRLEHLDGGYTVCFESHTADGDLAGLFQGLPDDRAQLPRFGYVVQGRTGFRFPDREETYEAGDAYYVPRGIRRSTTPAPRSSSSAPGHPRRDDPRRHEEPGGGRRHDAGRVMRLSGERGGQV